MAPPFLEKKSFVRASRISEQKTCKETVVVFPKINFYLTLSSNVSLVFGSVHLTMGMSMWIILNLLGLWENLGEQTEVLFPWVPWYLQGRI